ncbi:MAG: prolyl oligopeptidase family serine peptidase [Treponema sp.]|nr:prolyl oligopeptidase family serine peptidase [Treponema sp.]
MGYTYWEPEKLNDNDKVPLIIWLHGIAEGGENPYIPLLSCKVSNLTNDNIQSYFGDKGACILVPQAKTSWLESTSKDIFGNRLWVVVDMKNTVKKFTGRVSTLITENFSLKSGNKDNVPAASVSYYTEALKALIDDYVAARPYIDKNRIYIMGGSAGGYMVVNMCIQYPDFFAAAVPCSEAYPDAKITGFQLDILAKQHIWFVHAKNDKTISPDKYDKKTVRRLSILAAEDIKYSLFDNVISDDGHEYSGHDTWIYLFADKCKDENGMSLYEWLASKSLP